MTKYIFVTGGVVSGLGKGITSASLGNLLKARGLSIVNQKLDMPEYSDETKANFEKWNNLIEVDMQNLYERAAAQEEDVI